MNELAERISDSELEVMKLFWRAEDALSSTEIREELQRTMGWNVWIRRKTLKELKEKGRKRCKIS